MLYMEIQIILVSFEVKHNLVYSVVWDYIFFLNLCFVTNGCRMVLILEQTKKINMDPEG